MNKLAVKRVYDAYEETDGYRILVDRPWPRGIKKENAHLDAWNKDIAPSNELRKWYGHDPEKYAAFAGKYTEELNENEEASTFVQQVQQLLKEGNVTLLYSAKTKENNAAVLAQWLMEKKEK